MEVDTKAIYKDIAKVKKEITKLEADIEEWTTQRSVVLNLIERGIEVEENHYLLGEVEKTLAEYNATLPSLRLDLTTLEASLPKKPELPAPKFDPEKHPLLKKNVEKVEPAKPIIYSTGDLIEAQWTDKQWYTAKILMTLGSASNPQYKVRFLDYKDADMTVDRGALRPVQSEGKKRKADGPPSQSQTMQTTTSSALVISGPVSMNPSAQVTKEAAKDSEVPQKNKRKVGGEKALERKKANWQNFTRSNKKVNNKESMFRSGTSINSKVGFTGSGAGMTEIRKRVRPTYKTEGDTE
ncbi:hypothetical protein CC78DRAFT_546217 [Lojkania enalia]|uniref:Tudor domain-containing protein n=1 Tax=Lojkania enalia TaxID=147567 RepID=A0A9P4N1Y3_9PLEO|nr:hypothetical protein CC78DRAFT_546217 [Didymosphaeria enalia]